MTLLDIGDPSEGRHRLRLPVEAVTQTFAILAKRGVGKTYTAKVMAEEMLAQRQRLCVIDPLGVWWGLRAGADGTDAGGYPVIVIGGGHGDLPLVETAGQVIAELAVQPSAPSLVIDLSGLRKGAQRRFATDFLEALYHRNREPLHLFVDEADAFAPQRTIRGEERMLGSMEDVVRRGRSKGIGVTLISQRSAVLNKDVLSQCEVLVALRTVGPQDRDAIDAWVKDHGDQERRARLMADLPSLPVGTAYVWSPGWLDLFGRYRIRLARTFDSSATPKVGERPKAATMRAVDLAALQTRMEATIAEAEANDPTKLRAKIRALEADLARKAPVEKVVETIVEIRRVEVPVLTPQDRVRLREMAATLVTTVGEFMEAMHRVNAALGESQDARVAREAREDKMAEAIRRFAASTPTQPTQRPPTPPPSAQDDRGLNGGANTLRAGARKMLDVLARHYPLRVTKAQLGTLAGMAHTGGTFGNYLSTMRRSGYVDVVGDVIGITDAGLAAAGGRPGTPMTAGEVRDQWRRVLRAGARRMFDALVAVYPAGIARDDLGVQSGIEMTGGTFGNYLSTLRRNGLVVDRDGLVHATPVAVGDL